MYVAITNENMGYAKERRQKCWKVNIITKTKEILLVKFMLFALFKCLFFPLSVGNCCRQQYGQDIHCNGLCWTWSKSSYGAHDTGVQNR